MNDNKREQLEARDGQIETDGEFEIQRKEVAGIDLSTQALQELTAPELVDIWNQVERDYILLKWKLALLISGKFNSKKEFGKFLQKLKTDNPNHALCMINQSTFYRYARAARFCDKFKIYNLKECGISPTAIYDLSEIKNEPVVDDRFIRNINNKNLPVPEIKLLIYQAHSITGELTTEPVESTKSPEMELQAQHFEHLEAIKREKQTKSDDLEKEGFNFQPEQLTRRPMTLHGESTNQLTEQAMAQEILSLIDSYNLTLKAKLYLLRGVIIKSGVSEMRVPVG